MSLILSGDLWSIVGYLWKNKSVLVYGIAVFSCIFKMQPAGPDFSKFCWVFFRLMNKGLHFRYSFDTVVPVRDSWGVGLSPEYWYALFGHINEVESKGLFVGRLWQRCVMEQILHGGKVGCVRRDLGDETRYLLQERLYKRAFPPYVEKGTL